MDALRDAGDEAQTADLMLVLGTSLTVNPAASIPSYTLRNGGEVVIVNNMPTPLDSQAVQHFDDLGETFEGLRDLLANNGK
jgi:NAD-dependent deacetylase